MLWKSKLSSAPSSARSSVSFSRPSRCRRSRSKSTRSSQSTAFGPYVRMPLARPQCSVTLTDVDDACQPMLKDCSVRVAAEDAPDHVGRLRSRVAEPVRRGGGEADGVAGRQLVGVEADIHRQATGEDVAELLPGVAHERAVAGGAGARLVGHVQEL